MSTPNHWLAAKRALDQGDLDAADAHLARLKPAEVSRPAYIPITASTLKRGTVLMLTPEQFAAALRLGKAYRRNQQRRERMAKEPKL